MLPFNFTFTLTDSRYKQSSEKCSVYFSYNCIFMFTQYKKICSINVYINLFFYETINYFALRTFLFDMKNSEKTIGHILRLTTSQLLSATHTIHWLCHVNMIWDQCHCLSSINLPQKFESYFISTFCLN